MERKLIVVTDWNDTPLTRQIKSDCMLMLSAGIYYHYRLETVFMVRSMMPAHLRSMI